AIIDNVYTGRGSTPEQVVGALERLADEHAGTTLLLMVNAEHEVEMVQAYRERLTSRFVVPMATDDALRRAADKEVLEDVCADLGIATPETVAVAMDDVRAGRDLPLDLTYPVVLKPAVSAEHLLMGFPGKKKVYTADDRAGAQAVLQMLAEHGFSGTVLVQQLIPGDDTQGRTVTCYRDRSGRVTLMASGQLLLGLHAPTMIGNSAAILTEPQPDLEDQASAILEALDFTGFANFDVKVDPRDGRAQFLDLNPRIGRPNYYANVAGVNPAQAVVEDHLEDGGPARLGRDVGLYSYVPWPVLRRYLSDPALRRRVTAVRRRRGLVHPLAYSADRNRRRLAYRWASAGTLTRDFARHYPRPTAIGF
ncbi:carboxylate--amine ligase, partial [Georgenia sp. 10Sc9-8]|nr:carboxylate--amine ligase [Georgenia halotolerans]